MSNERRIQIGLFDSGVGGLTVLRALEKLATYSNWDVNFIYLADTARCPYGDRQSQELLHFSAQLTDWLVARGVDIVIMACNTSAATAGTLLRLRCPVPMFDPITAVADHIFSQKINNVIVMASQATVNSQAFSRAIQERDASVNVTEVACPELVPLIEQGQLYNKDVRQVIQKYLKGVELGKVDGLIMGCTHFPLVSQLIRELLPSDIQLIDPAEYLAKSLSSAGLFEGNKDTSRPKIAPKCEFYTTGLPESFARIAEIVLKRKFDTVHGIKLEELPASSHSSVENQISSNQAYAQPA